MISRFFLLAILFVVGCGEGKKLLSSTDDHEYQEVGQGILSAAKPTTGKAVVYITVVGSGTALAFPDSFQFSRSISGRALNFEYGCLLNNGTGKIELPAPGYYVAGMGGQRWSSIPINSNTQYEMEFTIGGGYTMKIMGLPTAINLVKNTAMADANENNPTAVVGAQEVKLASVGLSVEAQEAYSTRELSVVSGLPPGVFSRVFENLKVKVQNTQIGRTVGTLDDTVVTFQFDPILSTPSAPAFVVVDFYGDISSSATAEDLAMVNNRASGPFTVFNADGFGVNSGDHAQSRESVNSQRLYLALYGDVRITLSPDNYMGSFDGRPVMLRAGGEYTVNYRVAAGAGEDVDLSLFTPVLYSGGTQQASPIEEARLYKNTLATANLLGTTIPVNSSLTSDGRTDRLPFRMDQSAVIAVNTFRDIILWYRLRSDCPIGANITFVLQPEVSGGKLIEARGMTSGQNLPLGNVFSSDGQHSLWVAGRVVAAAEEQQLMDPIRVQDYSITKTGQIKKFDQSVINGIWTIDVEFVAGILPAGTTSVRLVFNSIYGGMINMTATVLEENSAVRFQKPWIGHHEEVLLQSEGTEVGKNYGDITFFTR